jgi:hypothetical protein
MSLPAGACGRKPGSCSTRGADIIQFRGDFGGRMSSEVFTAVMLAALLEKGDFLGFDVREIGQSACAAKLVNSRRFFFVGLMHELADSLYSYSCFSAPSASSASSAVSASGGHQAAFILHPSSFILAFISASVVSTRWPERTFDAQLRPRGDV